LLIRFALPIRLAEASVKAVEKKVQGNIPAYTIKA
jgi:hypothetical protein